MTISYRGAFYGGLAFALCIGLYLVWLWRPERQVRLHTENFFHAIDHRNWEVVADFVGNDFHDQWGDDKTRLRGSRIIAKDPAVQVETERATWIGKITVYSSDDGVMEVLDERVNKLPSPFKLEWHHLSGKPWDWKLLRVSNSGFEIPVEMY